MSALPDQQTAGAASSNPSIPSQLLSRTSSTSTKRPLMTHNKDGQVLSEKRLRRLEKNRLSARECRRRKREATENLQRQINMLEGENLRLRLSLRVGKEAEETASREEQDRITQEIDALLKSGASEAEIYAALEAFKEKYADYGRDRRTAMEYHLKNIERLLMPTQTTSVVMRAIQGGQESIIKSNNEDNNDSNDKESSSSQQQQQQLPLDTPTQAVSPLSTASNASTDSILAIDPTNPNLDPKALFQYLVAHLEVSPVQAVALKDSRLVAQELDGCLAQALRVLAELRTRLAQTGDDLATEFDTVRSILTPTQAAKFLVWVANNNACMHMLNELWDRVYPAVLTSSSNSSVNSKDEANVSDDVNNEDETEKDA